MDSATKKIVEYFGKIPYFYISNLKILDIPSYYLKIVVARMFKKGSLFRIKRGCYVSKFYIDEIKMDGKYNEYIEFIASKIYEPSYLSLEYVLYENNILTESPQNFTLITTKKTQKFRNSFGSFHYYSIKKDLFKGYKIQRVGDFIINKATTGKALFDFIYLRKSIITNKKVFDSFRLNISNLDKKEKKVFIEYVNIGGEGMKKIAKWIL